MLSCEIFTSLAFCFDFWRFSLALHRGDYFVASTSIRMFNFQLSKHILQPQKRPDRNKTRGLNRPIRMESLQGSRHLLFSASLIIMLISWSRKEVLSINWSIFEQKQKGQHISWLSVLVKVLFISIDNLHKLFNRA